MAQDKKGIAADKGKGKAVENGKPEDFPKDKDGKAIANGRKEDEKDDCMRRCPRLRDQGANESRAAAEELSEEDQQLKTELDMIVERLTVRSFSNQSPVEQTY